MGALLLPLGGVLGAIAVITTCIGALIGAVVGGTIKSQDVRVRTPQSFSLNRDDKKYIKKIKSK